MKLYLAGPMRGVPEFNFPAFFRAAAQLEREGHIVFNPAAKDNAEYGTDFSKDNPEGREDIAAKIGDIRPIGHGFLAAGGAGDDAAEETGEIAGAVNGENQHGHEAKNEGESAKEKGRIEDTEEDCAGRQEHQAVAFEGVVKGIGNPPAERLAGGGLGRGADAQGETGRTATSAELAGDTAGLAGVDAEFAETVLTGRAMEASDRPGV